MLALLYTQQAQKAQKERTVDELINDLTVPFEVVLQTQAEQARRRRSERS